VYIYNVTVIDVIDGNTVEVDIDLGFGLHMRNKYVKLHGIDCPESKTLDVVEKRFGILAKKEVEKYMTVGSKQQMVSVLPKNKISGNILGEFLVKDPNTPETRFNLNRHLVTKHFAVAYDGSISKDKLIEEHHENRMRLMKF